MKLEQVVEAKHHRQAGIEAWVRDVKSRIDEEQDELYNYDAEMLPRVAGNIGIVEIDIDDEGKRSGYTQETAEEAARRAWGIIGLPHTSFKQALYYSEGDEDETFSYIVKYDPSR